MHRLAREIRFSIDPFGGDTEEGYNSYCSKPGCEGVGLFFSLWVVLEGAVDGETGFVVNVSEIDKEVRRSAVPVFAEKIREVYSKDQSLSILEICGILRLIWGKIRKKFGPAEIKGVEVGLNPYRKVSIESEECGVFYFSEKFEFSAMHTLWNDKFSEDKNLEVFGKCANPAGHGHNYIIEVTIEQESDEKLEIKEFERIVDSEFIQITDHKNLNADLDEFKDRRATVENIAAFAWQKLEGKFGEAVLKGVKVWENDRTWCSYCE